MFIVYLNSNNYISEYKKFILQIFIFQLHKIVITARKILEMNLSFTRPNACTFIKKCELHKKLLHFVPLSCSGL
jgi:hypothetical protein